MFPFATVSVREPSCHFGTRGPPVREKKKNNSIARDRKKPLGLEPANALSAGSSGGDHHHHPRNARASVAQGRLLFFFSSLPAFCVPLAGCEIHRPVVFVPRGRKEGGGGTTCVVSQPPEPSFSPGDVLSQSLNRAPALAPFSFSSLLFSTVVSLLYVTIGTHGTQEVYPWAQA